MTTKRKVVIAISIIILITILLGVLIPKKIIMERTSLIEAPVQIVYNVVNDLATHLVWNRMLAKGSDFEVLNTIALKGLGAQLYVTQEQGNGGMVEIVAAAVNDSLIYTFTKEGAKKSAQTGFKFSKDNENTTVTLQSEILLPFPKNIFGFIVKMKQKKSLKESLKELENLALQRYKDKMYRGYKIEEHAMNDRYFLINRAEVNLDNISQYYAQNISALYQAAQDAGVLTTGMPCGLFFKYDMQKSVTDMAAALPTNSEVFIKEATTYVIKSRQSLQIDYYGDYRNISLAHNAMNDYLADRNILSDAPVIEEYVIDQSKETDPDKWLTRIYYLPAE